MDVDGSKEGDPPPESSSSRTNPFRVKLYPSTFAGPFLVYFRKKDKPINVLLISSEIYKKYSSVKEIKKISLDKLRVIFGKREDANSLLESQLFANSYRVYAPCDFCEISGVIYDESLKSDDVRNSGVGVFKNNSISPVQVLECNRLSKLILSDKGSEYVHSNCFKITFAGSVLPDFVVVNNVTFDVRLYFPKLMHCERCLLFGHTIKFCSNKPKCGKCGEPHSSTECGKSSDICIYCKQKHLSFKECSVYKSKQAKLNQKLKNKNQTSYSEILKSSDDFSDPNIFDNLSVDVQDDSTNANEFIYKPPIKRKKVTNLDKKSNFSFQPTTSFDKHFPRLNSSQRTIPGFQKIDDEPSTSKKSANINDTSENATHNNDKSSILVILEELVELLGFSNFWKSLIKKILPFLANLFEKLNSFGPIIASFFSS
uniref:Putative i ele4g aae n=1 Tax=Aedes albopictus TaxID=7160 RepID=A0A1W7R614_AEDAL